MEDDLNYTTVTFTARNGVSTFEKPTEVEIIYDNVKLGAQTPQIIPVVKEKKAPPLSYIHLAATGLAIICAILVLIIIVLKIQSQTALSEQLQENSNLTAQIQRLLSQKDDLEGQTQELTRDRDGLNWTLGVILEYKNFPVETHCPQKVCKPCLDDWVLFQSNCYLFTKHKSSWGWSRWLVSKEECQKFHADLVVIESQEEQEFINNHTEKYNDDKHGYWIGLNKEDWTEDWRWSDGSNISLELWREQETLPSWYSCALTSPHGNSQAKWMKVGCDMKNRYICETRALTKPDEEPEAFE